VALVSSGRVLVAGQVAGKPATQVPSDASISITSHGEVDYASRGAHKLRGALDALASGGLRVAGRRCLDAGASTGGFTDVLLRAGAREVVAVDVGYGQLAWRLQTDPRVQVHDRTNVRDLSADRIGGPVDLVVADLSFISLRLVLHPLAEVTVPCGDLLVMVKPQFEVGRGRVGPGGVVRDPARRTEAVTAVAEAAGDLGLTVHAVVPSPLPGPAGNVEYFLWLARPDLPARPVRPDVTAGPVRPGPLTGAALTTAVEAAVREGPA
jgi:23S rRNA (cytidine1920-2'-O)/16S rRNA (cytidine1409-2'-O)-methyltransferase